MPCEYDRINQSSARNLRSFNTLERLSITGPLACGVHRVNEAASGSRLG
jgi:hypothetical protein